MNRETSEKFEREIFLTLCRRYSTTDVCKWHKTLYTNYNSEQEFCEHIYNSVEKQFPNFSSELEKICSKYNIHPNLH